MSLKIIKTGLLDSIQDGGRHGYAHAGISPTGPMDHYSASLANAILGKDLLAPVIEVHFPGPVIEITSACILAITGAELGAVIDDEELPLCQPVLVRPGSFLRFRKPVSGARGYIGVYPGMILKKWLGSVSTNLRITGGNAFQPGNIIETIPLSTGKTGFQILPWHSRQVPGKGKIRILRGPEWFFMDEKAHHDLLSEYFAITQLSDRMGFRLNGPVLHAIVKEQLLSSAVGFGTIQLLPNGSTIVLMAEHPTTGGYPRIASVIRADLGRLAQMRPGDILQFSLVDIEDAEQLYLSQVRSLEELKNLCGAEMNAFLKR
jgi:biotin-dependent carboxylase-like uncharacterized protein